MEINWRNNPLYSFLKIDDFELKDTVADTSIIYVMGLWGETQWYKKNDSTFSIHCYTNLPVKNEKYWQKFLFAKLTLSIHQHSYSLERDKRHIGYPVLTSAEIEQIKEEVKLPCDNFSFYNYQGDSTTKMHIGESSMLAAGWCAVAIMNGYREFVEIFNTLETTMCANGIYLEAYYELQTVLTFFELKIVRKENEYHGLLKEN